MVASAPSYLRNLHRISDLCECWLWFQHNCNDAYIITKNRAGIENLSDIANLPFLTDPAEIDEATSRGLDSPPLELISYR